MDTLSYPKQTKARKEHRCDFCGERILIGESYEKSTYAYDGHVYDWKAHNYCSKLASRLNLYADADEGVSMDYFMEAIHEEHDHILISNIPNELQNELSDIIRQLKHVSFHHKLWFVIRYYNKLDKKNEL